ncbi:MAG: hypothetical protein FWD06_11065 [Oscillospiraceae bacterium]|nr:hypothetical protein [Oscillospiraceae bacterium]
MQRKRKNNWFSTAISLFLAAGLVVAIVSSASQIVSRSEEYRAAQSEYTDLREQAGSEDENEDGGIQWDALAAINPGVRANENQLSKKPSKPVRKEAKPSLLRPENL